MGVLTLFLSDYMLRSDLSPLLMDSPSMTQPQVISAEIELANDKPRYPGTSIIRQISFTGKIYFRKKGKHIVQYLCY